MPCAKCPALLAARNPKRSLLQSSRPNPGCVCVSGRSWSWHLIYRSCSLGRGVFFFNLKADQDRMKVVFKNGEGQHTELSASASLKVELQKKAPSILEPSGGILYMELGYFYIKTSSSLSPNFGFAAVGWNSAYTSHSRSPSTISEINWTTSRKGVRMAKRDRAC